MAQTTIQKSTAIRKGSVKVQIGDDFSSLVDIGALRNPVITSLVGQQNIEFDNVDELKKFVNGKKVQVSFDLAEINLSRLATLDAGLVTLSTVAGTLVSGASQVIANPFVANKFYPITNQNGDGSAITVNSVTGGTDGALTADDDFHVTVDSQGIYGIVLNTVAGGTNITTLAQTITIDYDYTPSASKKLTFTDSGTKTKKVIRLVNTDENSKEFRIDINECTNFVPISIDFAGDDEEDVAIVPIQCEGDIVEIVDEQQTT